MEEEEFSRGARRLTRLRLELRQTSDGALHSNVANLVDTLHRVLQARVAQGYPRLQQLTVSERILRAMISKYYFLDLVENVKSIK